MSISRRLVILACVAALCGGALAQDHPTTETAPPKPPAEPIMQYIPAGALGFVVVNNVQGLTAGAETFLNDIGVGQMMGLQQMPGGLTGMIQAQAMLGQGFNPNGGFAMVMLDPQQFGVDLTKMMGMGGPTDPAAAETDEPVEEPKLPFIVLVCGSSVQEVFGNYPIEQVGGVSRVALRMGPMFAKQLGDYIALSPTTEALAAMMQTPQKAAAQLSASQAKAVGKSDIAVHVDMKIAGPIYSKMMEQFESQMASMAGMGMNVGSASFFSAYMSFYREMLTQVDDVIITGRFTPKALVFSENVRWNSESEWGQAIAAYKATSGKLLDRLPNLPYVLAAGSGWTGDPEKLKTIAADMISRMLATEALETVPAETKAKVVDLTAAYYDEISGMQMVVGGAPEGSGVFGLAYVIKCKQAETLKSMCADGATIANEMVQALAADDEDIKQIKIAYLMSAGAVGDTAYDAIDITSPELDEMPEYDREDMKKMLGEDRLRFRVAAVDDTTVVLTFGGGELFLAETLNAARTSKDLVAPQQLAEATEYMPSDPMTLMLIDGGNLMQVIVKGMSVMDPEYQLPPLNLAGQDPMVIGMSYSGNEMEAAAYVPNSFIKGLMQNVPMLMMGPPPSAPPAGESSGNEDF